MPFFYSRYCLVILFLVFYVMSYDLYTQFTTIAVLHLFAVMSPGPDFALIIGQSIVFGRKASIVTSIGIGVGILFHIFWFF